MMDISTETIKEKYLEDYPKIISLEKTEIILSQMKKNICKIHMDDGSKGTGFFCRISFPNKNNLSTFLITNYHLIDETHIEKENQIILTFNNDEIKRKLKYMIQLL